MSDIVEIALNRLTDDRLFERMACEIMREEGYPAIKPLGGTRDGGKDADQKPLYVADGKKQRTIFQMSREENALNKIRKTIRRLEDLNEEYGSLIYVTTRFVDAYKQDDIKKKIREEFDVFVDIYEQSTLVTRLSDYNNGIFQRYFPNIDAQLADLRSKELRDILAKDRESALLRMSLMCTFSTQAPVALQSTFDNLILGIIAYSYPNSLQIENIKGKLFELSPAYEVDIKDIETSLKRLELSGLVILSEGMVKAISTVVDSIISSDSKKESCLEALVEDVIDIIISNSADEIDGVEEDRLRRNCRDVIIDYLRLFGHELKDQGQRLVYLDAIPTLVSKAKRQVSEKHGELLIASLAELLEKPNDNQARIVTSLAFSYLGAAILGLDPVLRELSADKIAGKTFYLDTDIIIACLIEETPISSAYTSIVNRLIDSGAKVFIPEACVYECIDHASYSKNTYNHFGDRLLALPETTVPEQVWNGFVKGFYYGRKNGKIPNKMTYEKYLRNYYDKDDAFTFMCESLKHCFNDKVLIKKMSDFINEDDIPKDKRQDFENEIYIQLAGHAKKAEYRTNDQNLKLAQTDAKIYLSIYYLNIASDQKSSNILSGNYYLITSSGRYISCAQKIGLKGRVTTRLQSVAGVLTALGKINMTPTEFMQLLENPFLVYAVNTAREDIGALVNAGVRLRGVSLPRMRRDLDEGLHNRITALNEITAKRFDENDPSSLGDEEYVKMIDEARRRGYYLEIGAHHLSDELKKYKEDYEKRIKSIEKYSELIETFGKRKRKYLKRFEEKIKG